MEKSEGRSLPETPTWAVATVVTSLVALGFFFNGCLNRFGKWLRQPKRKPLLAALEKIKDELMVFGLLSLLMGHWIKLVSKICVKSSSMSSDFYLCSPEKAIKRPSFVNHIVIFKMESHNTSFSSALHSNEHQGFCPEGHQSFASYESLEQLHRLLFVLGITHVLYSIYAIGLAVVQIYRCQKWESHAQSLALDALRGSDEASRRMTRLSTFISHQTSHPWSKHRVLVWLLCFSRQFWSSINQADYKALRIGFITSRELPLTYDFHRYMLRSMEEEFRDIVGISIPLWIYTVLCILLGVQGTNVYFWISFGLAILILLIGAKLHVIIVVKLAVEIMEATSQTGIRQFNLRDELFWFANPRLLLRLIQFITFQNAFEMAMYIWSLWEIKEPSCFTENVTFLVIRLTFGIVSQFWCSFITFPLYVIVAQMGSKYKKSIVSENVRRSLHGWKQKAKRRCESTSLTAINTASTSSLDSLVDEDKDCSNGSRSYKSYEGFSGSNERSSSIKKFQHNEISPYDAHLDMMDDMERYRNDQPNQNEKDSSSLLHKNLDISQ